MEMNFSIAIKRISRSSSSLEWYWFLIIFVLIVAFNLIFYYIRRVRARRLALLRQEGSQLPTSPYYNQSLAQENTNNPANNNNMTDTNRV